MLTPLFFKSNTEKQMNRDKRIEQKVELLKRKFKSPFGYKIKLILIPISQIQFCRVQLFCVIERVLIKSFTLPRLPPFVRDRERDFVTYSGRPAINYQGKITRAMTHKFGSRKHLGVFCITERTKNKYIRLGGNIGCVFNCLP